MCSTDEVYPLRDKKTFWAYFGKISAVATLSATLLGIWTYFNQPHADIEAYINPHPHSIRPDLHSAISSNLDAFKYQKLKESLKNSLPKSLSVDEIGLIELSEVIEKIHEKSWEAIDTFHINDHRGFSIMKIENNGEKSALNLKVDFPDYGSAIITREDDSQESIKFKKVLSIGELRAGKSIFILIWSKTEVDEHSIYDVSVTHDNGMGEVYWPIYAQGLSKYAAKYPSYFLVFIYIIFVSGFLLGFMLKSSHKPDEGPSQ